MLSRLLMKGQINKKHDCEIKRTEFEQFGNYIEKGYEKCNQFQLDVAFGNLKNVTYYNSVFISVHVRIINLNFKST